MLTRRNGIVATSIVLCITAASVAYFQPFQPAWQKRISETPRWVFKPGHNEAHQRVLMRVQNELFRLSNWNTAVAQELDDIAHAGDAKQYVFTESGDAVSLDDASALSGLEWVLLYSTERIRLGAPIDPDARTIIDDIFVRAAAHPEPAIRLAVATSICYAGLVEDPRFLGIAEVLETDSDPDVAANARRQLSAYNSYGARKGERE
jgi:hypothetical protein